MHESPKKAFMGKGHFEKESFELCFWRGNLSKSIFFADNNYFLHNLIVSKGNFFNSMVRHLPSIKTSKYKSLIVALMVPIELRVYVGV